MKDLRHIIKYAGEGTLMAPKGSSQQNKGVKLYKLDFSNTFVPIESYEDILKETKGKSVTGETDRHTFSYRGLVFSYSLPPIYDKMVSEATFALPTKALDTIKYLLLNASLHEDNPIYKNFNGGVKDSLREIHREFIHKAIILAFDYLYDPEKKYYRRGNEEVDKYTLRDMAIYTFWRGRTGRGLQGLYAGFYGKGNPNYEVTNNSGDKKTRQYIAREIDEHERLQEEMRQAIEFKLSGTLSAIPDDEPIAPEFEKSADLVHNPLKIFKVVLLTETMEIKDCKLTIVEEGERTYKVISMNETNAVVMVKNLFANDKTFPGVFNYYRCKVSEINMIGLKPEVEGIITTEEYHGEGKTISESE